MSLSPGSILHNRYRIQATLGKGGMGTVYRALDTRLHLEVAIKENIDTSESARKQFEHEARLLARLSHPNLPRVIDHFFIPDQGQYLVMDLVEGESLQTRFDRLGGLPIAETVPWILQVCDALIYLHSQPEPVIHRDIKPANIKIAPDGQAKLVDFGISKLHAPDRVTTRGAKGFITSGYSPPEQYGQGRTDSRSDVYALGATLYHLLTGQKPPESTALMTGTATLLVPSQLNAQISPEVERVILRALESDTARRFQSVGELRQALQAALQAAWQAAPELASQAEARAVPDGETATRSWWLSGRMQIGLLALFLIAVGVSFVMWGAPLLSTATPTMTVTATLPPTVTPMLSVTPKARPLTLGDAGFEEDADVWQGVGDCHLDARYLPRTHALSGDRYLRITHTPACTGFYQDVAVAPQPDKLYTFGIWIASPNRVTRAGHVAITASGASVTETQTKTFHITDEHWRCVETTLAVQQAGHTTMRFQVYLDGWDAIAYDFDEAVLLVQDADDPIRRSACSLLNAGFEEGGGVTPWSPWRPRTNAEVCDVSVAQDVNIARSGEKYFVINDNENSDCEAFHQDIALTPILGQRYKFQIWARSSDGSARTGGLILWTGEHPLDRNGVIDDGGQEFWFDGDAWTCLETSLVGQPNVGDTVRAEVFLDSPGVDYYFDDAVLQVMEEDPCPPQIYSGGFEADDVARYWTFPEPCAIEVRQDTDGAHSGAAYLSVVHNEPPCNSFFQAMPIEPVQGERYHYRVWARSADGSPQQVEVVIWARGAPEEEKARDLFTVQGPDWQCLETSLRVAQGSHTELIPATYTHSPDGVLYHFDDAYLWLGESQGCPHPALQINDVRVTQSAPFYPGSTAAITVAIESVGDAPVTAGQIVNWIAEAEGGEPINLAYKTATPAPALEVDARTVLPVTVNIPSSLEPSRYYVVIEADANRQLSQDGETLARVSLPMNIVPCADAVLCDMPPDHWAYDEAVALLEADITTGCRSDVTELPKPFCPNPPLSRNHLAIFLVRLLEGPDFQPPDVEIRHYFDDVTVDAWWSRHIEHLYTYSDEIPLDTADCPPVDGKLLYCPALPVKRGDLARYLAIVLDWDLTSVQGNTFVDLSGDGPVARAAEYMWRQGIIPDHDADCPPTAEGRRFCPDIPATRACFAVFAARAFGFVEALPR